MSLSFTIAEDAPKLPKTPWRFALYFYKQARYALFGIFFFETLQASCTITLPFAVKQIIDAVNLANESGVDVFEAAKDPLIFFAWLNLGIVLFSRASGALVVSNGPVLRGKIRKSIFKYLQFHSHRYFVTHFAGSLANRISEVSTSCLHALWTIVFTFYPLIIQSIVALIILYGASEKLALVLFVWLSIYTFVSIILARKCQVYSQNFAAARSKVSGQIVDSVTNMMNTKMFARGNYEGDYLTDYIDFEIMHAKKTFWFMEKMRWFQFISAMILLIAMVTYALKIWSEGEMTVGEFSMVAGIAIMLIEAARGLSRSFLEFFEYIGNISDGVSVFIQPHEIIDDPKAATLNIDKAEINFDHVNFTYHEGFNVFKQLNIKIKSHQKVGLVGFSGSGKSTFVNLLLRLFEPSQGEISIDGQNILKVTQDSLRENISMIPQDPVLFHRSLLENIRYGKLDASDDDVIDAAKKANAHDFILQTEQGYDSLVGERGVKLSGGQRQRIAIARAILKDSPILVLDEATSSLDSVTEKKIQLGLERLMENKTVIIIAHRLSTISGMDRILVFDQGAIIEDGNHETLLKNESGHYSKLWNMQAGGFLPDDLNAPHQG